MSEQRYIAILDTFYGQEREESPRWFEINPMNLSGERLYTIVNGWHHFFNASTWAAECRPNILRVTNACRYAVSKANEHAKPDPEWLADNLSRFSRYLAWRGAKLLVCGKVAQATYEKCGYVWKGEVIYMPHPAARTWTLEQLSHYCKIVSGLEVTPKELKR